MSSETERITNEVMDRLDFYRLAGHLGGASSQEGELKGQMAIGPNYTNQVYRELERPSRDSSNYLCGILRHMLKRESFSDGLEQARTGASAETE
jgi:hypothetical protein